MKKIKIRWKNELIPFLAYLVAFILIFKLSSLSLSPIPDVEIKYKVNAKSVDGRSIEIERELPSSSRRTSANTTSVQATGRSVTVKTKKPTAVAKSNTFSRQIPIDSVTESLLAEYGLPRYIARNWMKYIQKGGTVRTEADVKKLYGMTDSIFDAIRSHLVFDEAPSTQEGELRISVNTATEEDWKKLRGIGSVLSKRIIKFRSRLGGFTRIAQVRETYGISDSLFLTIQPFLHLVKKVDRIDINTISEEELASHPYVDYRQAEVIIKYRNNRDGFDSLNDLLPTQVVDSSWLHKMRPYLSFVKNEPL